jgi:hypothetical protein
MAPHFDRLQNRAHCLSVSAVHGDVPRNRTRCQDGPRLLRGALLLGGARQIRQPGWALGGSESKYPQTWNLYSYALNNPLRHVGPTGHDPDPADGASDDKIAESLKDPVCAEAHRAKPAPQLPPRPTGAAGGVDDLEGAGKQPLNGGIGLLNLFGANITPLSPTDQTQAHAMRETAAAGLLPGPSMMVGGIRRGDHLAVCDCAAAPQH